MIEKLLDIEKDLRECDALLASGGRHLNNTRDSSYFDLMEELGFIVNNRFISISDMFEIASEHNDDHMTFMLESVANELSIVYRFCCSAQKGWL